MKRLSGLGLAIAAALIISLTSSPSAATEPFSDVKPGHWAYEALRTLAGRGYLEGYPDGTFKGGKTLTRYELAMAVQRITDRYSEEGLSQEDLLSLEKLTVELADELELLSKRIDDLGTGVDDVRSGIEAARASGSKKVSISGDFSLYYETLKRSIDTRGDDHAPWVNLGLNFTMSIDDGTSAMVRLFRDDISLNGIGVSDPIIDEAWVDIKGFFGLGDLRVGRQWMKVGHSIVLDDKMDGVSFSRILDRVEMTLFAFSTRKANGAANSQWDGDSSGSRDFYLYSQERSVKTGGGLTDFQNPGGFNAANTGAGLTGSGPLAAFNPGTDRITLYSTQYDLPNPGDPYTGSYLNALPDNRWNNHAGLVLIGGYDDDLDGVADSLAPVSAPASAAAGRAFSGPAYGAPRSILDTAGSDSQASAALSRDWENRSAAGLDSWGIKIACEFGGHNLSAYYLMRRYDRFDPYTAMGDPWAAMVDQNNNGIVDRDSTGKDLSPSADPRYLGITLDGSVVKNLGYFFEFVRFDPDIANIGVDPETGNAVNSAGTGWKGNNLDTGNAWLVGLDWQIRDDLNLIVQYAVGDEEFIPASIFETQGFNGMFGRMNEDLSGGPVGGDLYGTNSLTGVKDLLVKLNVRLDEKTLGYVKYELARDNDSSPERLIAGDPDLTGHPRMDYRMWTIHFSHLYKPNTKLSFWYENLTYDDSALDDATYTGNRAYTGDDVNGGGWHRVTGAVEVGF